MNRITRRFLSGASFFALSLALPTSLARAGITVNTNAHGPVTVAGPASTTDFILVTGTGVVNGNIVNSGLIFGGAGNAIEIGSSASVTGDIINRATDISPFDINVGFITANTYGIVNYGNVGGDISNRDGTILVINNAMTGNEIAGIAVLNGTVGGIINDSGHMSVIGVGNFGRAVGIEITNTGDLFETGARHARIRP